MGPATGRLAAAIAVAFWATACGSRPSDGAGADAATPQDAATTASDGAAQDQAGGEVAVDAVVQPDSAVDAGDGSSAAADGSGDASPSPCVTYGDEIQAILKNSCTPCHTYETECAVAKAHAFKIQGVVKMGAMPPKNSAPLTPEQKAKIAAWFSSGARCATSDCK